MTENEGDVFRGEEIGKPVPGEDAFDGNGNVFPAGCNCLKKDVRTSLDISVQDDLAESVEDTEIHCSCM